MVNYESGGLKRMQWISQVGGQVGVVSYHLQSLLGAIELTALCAFMCGVGEFDARIRETLLYK